MLKLQSQMGRGAANALIRRQQSRRSLAAGMSNSLINLKFMGSETGLPSSQGSHNNMQCDGQAFQIAETVQQLHGSSTSSPAPNLLHVLLTGVGEEDDDGG